MKVPQVFRNPGGSPALQSEKRSKRFAFTASRTQTA
jgi:hypothetical protein